MDEFLKDGVTYLVVGATQNKDKYGYRVFAKLVEKGKKAVPINPKYEEIDGVRCYGSLEEVLSDKTPPNPLFGKEGEIVVVTVVPPEVTEKVVEQAAGLGIKKVWMQPGSHNDDVVKKAEELGVETVQACIVVDGFGWQW